MDMLNEPISGVSDRRILIWAWSRLGRALSIGIRS